MSTVKLRNPRNSGTSSSGNKFGRPRSWTEFNTRFHAVSIPIDLAPVPKMEDDVIKRREPNEYRKVRPKSASILDEPDSSLKIAGSNPGEGTRPQSPKYTSFMAPNPWRNVPKPKSSKISPEKNTGKISSAKVKNKRSNYDETAGNYDQTGTDYDGIKNAKNGSLLHNNCPEANKPIGNGETNATRVQQSASFSHTDSVDSAVVVSAGSSLYGTSSEKSPNRFEFRNSGEFDSTSSISDKSSLEFGNKVENTLQKTVVNEQNLVKNTDKEKFEARKAQTANFTLNLAPKVGESVSERSRLGGEKIKSAPNSGEIGKSGAALRNQALPTIVIYKTDDEMEFCAEDKTYRFGSRNPESKTGNYNEKPTVPSPLKSCYTPTAIYEDFVQYSDSENSSGDENSSQEISRNNIGYEGDRPAEEYTPKTTPTARLRQSSTNAVKHYDENDVIDDNNNPNGANYDVRSGTWPRRKPKKKEESIDAEQLMKKFLETRESHLQRFRNIYAESRKRVDDVMKGLKETMTQNGYREWYPRVR